jgi:hypothetical protein
MLTAGVSVGWSVVHDGSSDTSLWGVWRATTRSSLVVERGLVSFRCETKPVLYTDGHLSFRNISQTTQKFPHGPRSNTGNLVHFLFLYLILTSHNSNQQYPVSR